MKTHFFLVFLLLVGQPIFSQSSRKQTREVIRQSELHPQKRRLETISEIEQTINNGSSKIPIGTITEDAVTAIKIGESSNAYSFLLPSNNQISTVNNVGTNQGSVAFIYRQNINNCGGTFGDNGKLRYSISTSGGQFWNTGPGACYGLGPLNPIYTQSSRYPNLALFIPPGDSSTTSNLKLAYSAAILGDSWDGSVFGLASNITSSPVVDQEIYPFQNGYQYFSYSLVERVPGEFWAAAWTWDGINIGSDIILNRGIYDSNTHTINWMEITTVSPNYNLSFDGSPQRMTDINIAFSPDGMTGYIGILADLVGNQDSVLAPCFSASTDGGANWGSFEEFDIAAYEPFGLMDTIVKITDLDTVSNTIVNMGSRTTTGFEFDLTVDKHGNPHFVTIVAAAAMSNGDGTYTAPMYNLFSALGMMVFDFTKDLAGDWNMIPLSRQITFRGEFGDKITGGSDSYMADPWTQASRSPDGSKVFFSWTDSDTTGIGGVVNENPDFIAVGLDVDNYQLSPVINWTNDDINFSGKAHLPKIPPVSFYDGAGEHNIPTVIMDFGPPGTSILNPTSYYYFNNINIHDSTFNQNANFFSNCQSIPFSNILNFDAPDCGMNNGKAWITPGGGNGGYSYQWSQSAGGLTSDTAFSLSSGIFSVVVTDSFGCSDEKILTLNNLNAPIPTIVQMQNVSCNGLSDGSIDISLTGGTAPFTFSWSNGSPNQNLASIPAGMYDLVITDNANCLSYISAIISEPPALSFSDSVLNVTCNGGNNGAINLSIGGNSNLFSFLWSNGQTTEDLNNISAGTYTVTITDVNGCSKIESYTVTEPAPITSSFSTNGNASCLPPYTGTILVTISGGTPQYTVDWTGPGGFVQNNSSFISGLDAGEYTAKITDAAGCVYSDQVSVVGTNNTAIVSNITSSPNNGSQNGTASTSPSGGTAPYTFLWSNNQTTSTITNLDTGIYSVLIVDAQGCELVDSVEVGSNVSIDELYDLGINELKLYPNPAREMINLSMSLDDYEKPEITLFDLRGKAILRLEAPQIEQNHQFSIPLKNLAEGVYFLSVKTETGTIVKQFVKRH